MYRYENLSPKLLRVPFVSKDISLSLKAKFYISFTTVDNVCVFLRCKYLCYVNRGEVSALKTSPDNESCSLATFLKCCSFQVLDFFVLFFWF